MKYFLYIATLVTVLIGCKNSEQLVTTPNAPDWVKNRPIDNAYYIGIGSASKTADPVNYAQTAKKNAFDDLASEISVTIKSESFLNTMQVNKQVQEQFTSVIATSSNEQIEDFEVVDVYETPTDYYIYYRLSKAKHEAIKAEKKNRALSAAADQYVKGIDAANQGHVKTALDFLFKGLFEMKEYWNDVNPFAINGEEVYLDLAIYAKIQEVVQGIRLTTDITEIHLNSENGFRQDVVVTTKLNNTIAPGLPFVASYDNGRYRNQIKLTSDINGKATVAVMKVNVLNPQLQLELSPNLKELTPSGLDPLLVKPIMESLTVQKSVYPIKVTMPVIACFNQETNLGEPLSQPHLASPLQQALSKKGFQFTDRMDAADYVVYIEASTKQGGTSQGFHVAFLEMHIVVRNKNGDIVYRKSLQNIKGLQLNYQSAGIEAFKKGAKSIEKEIALEIADAII